MVFVRVLRVVFFTRCALRGIPSPLRSWCSCAYYAWCSSLSGLLSGRVAIVTGAGRGIGRATAELFAREGAAVLCADLESGVAEEAAEACGRLNGGRSVAFAGDVCEKVRGESFLPLAGRLLLAGVLAEGVPPDNKSAAPPAAVLSVCNGLAIGLQRRSSVASTVIGD